MTSLTPLSALRVSAHYVPSFKNFPNTSLHRNRPLLIYHSCFEVRDGFSASSVEAHLRKVGVVEPAWRYTMYHEHHYHSTCQEVLVIVSQRGAKLCFGGSKQNEGAVIVDVRQGDVVVVPAGVGHALLGEESGGGSGFQMVGSYPVGAKNWDMRTAKDGDGVRDEAWNRIKGLGWFERDPLYGDTGPVLNGGGSS